MASKNKINWISVNILDDMQGILDWIRGVQNINIKKYTWEQAVEAQKNIMKFNSDFPIILNFLKNLRDEFLTYYIEGAKIEKYSVDDFYYDKELHKNILDKKDGISGLNIYTKKYGSEKVVDKWFLYMGNIDNYIKYLTDKINKNPKIKYPKYNPELTEKFKRKFFEDIQNESFKTFFKS